MLISNGERDLGSFDYDFLNSNAGQKYWAELNDKLAGHSLKLAQRFLYERIILHQRYSKKLGQVFDSYKYKIKKDLLEKQKKLVRMIPISQLGSNSETSSTLQSFIQNLNFGDIYSEVEDSPKSKIIKCGDCNYKVVSHSDNQVSFLF